MYVRSSHAKPSVAIHGDDMIAIDTNVVPKTFASLVKIVPIVACVSFLRTIITAKSMIGLSNIPWGFKSIAIATHKPVNIHR